MALKDFIDDVTEEAEQVFASNFTINVTETQTVPELDDPVITYPNLDTGELGCKVIRTCVLYADVRRSTQLSLSHKPKTVAKLYSVFVRSMIRCAEHYNGKVRGIIGDRVMVLFDAENCYTNAVNTAILMHTVVSQIINKHFKHNEVRAGIGIDYGPMLVTKTGVIKYGAANVSYKSLVWLGRPANIASKLTDAANKEEHASRWYVNELHDEPPTPLLPPPRSTGGLGGVLLGSLMQPTPPTRNPFAEAVAGALSGHSGGLGLGLGSPFAGLMPPRRDRWIKVPIVDFVKKLKPSYLGPGLQHSEPTFRTFFPSEEYELTQKTPPILMTEEVLSEFARVNSQRRCIRERFWKRQPIRIPGDIRSIYGGTVYFSI